MEKRKENGEDVEIEEPEKPSDMERLILEHQTWTSVPSLLATLINRTSDGIGFQFDPKHRPKWPVVGPEKWWPEDQKKEKAEETELAEDGQPHSLLTRFFGKIGG